MSKIKSVPVPPEYVVKDVGKDDIQIKGRYMSGTKQKTYGTMRGAGAATRGKKFLDT